MGEGGAAKQEVRRRRIIERPRLIRMLDGGQGRIRMLVAPAGYGKTTLARQWLDGKTSAWYTGTPASTDVAALAAGIRSTVAALVPGSGSALMERLPVTPRPEEEAHILAGMLAGDLAGWPASAWLVFDDYHVIAGVLAAERFIETFLLEAPVNVLIVTRRRPGWASSRRILYGEVLELDRPLLAMTEAEARDLLVERQDVDELVAKAQGWPAVLGLAAMASISPPDLGTMPHLYGFFADEIYYRIDRRIRRVLCELALYDIDGRRVAVDLLRPDEAKRVIQVGADAGFLTDTDDGALDIHPLLRVFLERKLTQENPRGVNRIVARAVENLIQHKLWDAAFELIQRFSAEDVLVKLLEEASDGLLAAGRTPTLRSWISNASDTEPIVQLIGAELAFREGRFHRAQALSALAAHGPLGSGDLAARAHLVGARSAHVASHEDEAGVLYANARAAAESPKLRRIAALGELLVAIELERDEAPDLLRTLETDDVVDPTECLILADRRLSFETHLALKVDVERARASAQLVPLVGDPLVRTSFRNIFGYTLSAMGHFDEALELTEEQLADAEHHRLEFVLPYAYSVQALAKAGLRGYLEAQELLDEAEQRALKAGDRTAYHIAWAIRVRTYVAQGAFDLVLARALNLDSDLTRQLRSELTASYSLAVAGASNPRQACDLADEAQSQSRGAETQINARLTRALVASREGDRARALVHATRALQIATHTGLVESFVFGCRGCPEILVCLLEDASLHDDISRVLTISGDRGMARSMALSAPDHSVLTLSPREKEVLSLVAQGLSNREIGLALFISPVTVKVHVRHIFEKLGVKSRAAAAIRASQLGR